MSSAAAAWAAGGLRRGWGLAWPTWAPAPGHRPERTSSCYLAPWHPTLGQGRSGEFLG